MKLTHALTLVVLFLFLFIYLCINMICLIYDLTTAFENFLPKPILPDMVLHFTGRHSECEEVVRDITSEATRLFTICGPPGFGKTSMAIAVGHRLKQQGLPVYYLSLRDVKTAKDFKSELLKSFPARPGNKRPAGSTDQLCRVLSEIPSKVFIVLDNADNLFESREQQTSQQVLDLLRNIRLHCENVTFLCTTRMDLNIFLGNSFQGHKSIKITPLDPLSADQLVREHLPEANGSECSRIAKIGGRVPLAIILLCGLIKEDDKNPTQFLDEYCRSLPSIIDLLDDPDFPSDRRLKKIFDSSFLRLSSDEQNAFISLSVFVGETFDEKAAVNVIGGARIGAQKALRGLKRKCLITDSTTFQAKLLSFHPLIKSFAAEKGRHGMKGIIFQAQTRFLRHYVDLCRTLNQEFVAGNSTSTFLDFERDKENILHCLVQGVSNGNVCEEIFDVLSIADLFLDTMLYFDHAWVYSDVYNPALEKAKERCNVVATHQLILGKVFYIIPAKDRRKTAKELFDEAKEIEESNPSLISVEAMGKRMCYQGIFLLLDPKLESKLGLDILERGIHLLNSKNTTLKALSLQFLAVYLSQFADCIEKSTRFHELAITECKDRKYLHIFLLDIHSKGRKDRFRDHCSQPVLILTFTLLIGCLGRRYGISDTLEGLAVVVSEMEEEIEEKAKSDRSYFPILYYICRTLLKLKKPEEAYNLLERSLENAKKEYGEEHEKTAKILHSMGFEKYKTNDYVSALQFYKRSLDIRSKVHGELHPDVVDSYHKIGNTLKEMKNYKEALQSHEKALQIKLALINEQDSDVT